jgi:hypothetical protein
MRTRNDGATSGSGVYGNGSKAKPYPLITVEKGKVLQNAIHQGGGCRHL